MFISWDPPYTLPGLTVQYIISVGTEQHELNSTNYTYCPLNLTNREYIFNITTSNGAGNGSKSNLTVAFESSMDYSLFNMFTDKIFVDAYLSVVYGQSILYIGNSWTLNFLLQVKYNFLVSKYFISLHMQSYQLCFQPIAMVTIISCSVHNTSECYSANDVTVNNYTIVTTSFLPFQMTFYSQVFIVYASGQSFTSQNEILISK